MRKLLLAVCLFALPVAACSTLETGTVPAPGTYTNKTVLDEKIAITAHNAYKAWRLAVETGINAGYIKGQLAVRIANVDNQLYSALTVVDQAYATGNAASYAEAIDKFNAALNDGRAIFGSK
jgi:hypothetical protein